MPGINDSEAEALKRVKEGDEGGEMPGGRESVGGCRKAKLNKQKERETSGRGG